MVYLFEQNKKLSLHKVFYTTEWMQKFQKKIYQIV